MLATSGNYLIHTLVLDRSLCIIFCSFFYQCLLVTGSEFSRFLSRFRVSISLLIRIIIVKRFIQLDSAQFISLFFSVVSFVVIFLYVGILSCLFFSLITSHYFTLTHSHSRVLMHATILHRKKDGDWYIYPQFLGHENFNNVHKKVQKGYKIFKPTIHNVLSTRTNIVKIWLSLCLLRCVRFARYCGKMYSRHLFSYGGLKLCI